MITEAQVSEVRRLLQQQQLSQRQIARRLGISRGVIARIASGRRPDYSERERQRALDDEWCSDHGAVARCPECGGQVHLPCRLCRVRALKEQEAQIRREARENARRIALRQFLMAMLRRQLHQLRRDQPPERKVG